jgi:hypothetical protein
VPVTPEKLAAGETAMPLTAASDVRPKPPRPSSRRNLEPAGRPDSQPLKRKPDRHRCIEGGPRCAGSRSTSSKIIPNRSALHRRRTSRDRDQSTSSEIIPDRSLHRTQTSRHRGRSTSSKIISGYQRCIEGDLAVPGAGRLRARSSPAISVASKGDLAVLGSVDFEQDHPKPITVASKADLASPTPFDFRSSASR